MAKYDVSWLNNNKKVDLSWLNNPIQQPDINAYVKQYGYDSYIPPVETPKPEVKKIEPVLKPVSSPSSYLTGLNTGSNSSYAASKNALTPEQAAGENKRANSFLDNLTAPFKNSFQQAKDESYGSNSPYSKDWIPNWIDLPIRTVLDLPQNIPLTQRLLNSANNAMGVDGLQTGTGKPIEVQSTGFKPLDVATDFAGNLLGYAALPGPTGGNILNMTDSASKAISDKAVAKLVNAPGVVKNFAPAFLRGAIDNGAFVAAEDVGKGKNLKTTAQDVALNSLIGGGLMGTGNTILKSISALRTKVPEVKLFEQPAGPIQEQIQPQVQPLSGRFTIKNTALEKATNDWNDFVDYAQNKYGHYKLTDDEILQAAIDKNVDPFQLLDNIDKASSKNPFENVLAPDALKERNRMAQVAGVDVNTPVLQKPNLKPLGQELPIGNTNTPIQPILKPVDNNRVLGASIDNPLNTVVGKVNETPLTKTSEFKTNTMRNAEILKTPEAQKIIDDIGATYEVKPNEQSVARALDELQTNFDGAMERIRKADTLTSAEDATAAGLITRELRQRAEQSGNYAELKTWLETVQPKVTSTAQSLQAISTWKKLTKEGILSKAQQVVDSTNREGKKIYGKNFTPIELTEGDLKNITDTMDKYEKLPAGIEKERELQKAKQIIADKIPPTIAEKVKTIQRISLLLNPKTQVRNVLGNVILTGLENVKDIPGTALDKLVSLKTGERTTTLPSLKTQAKGFIQGAKDTLGDYKAGVSTSQAKGQFDLPEGTVFKNKALNNLERVTNTSLELGDRPFYQAAYNDALRQQMKLKGATTATEAMQNTAKQVAEERTLQNVSALVNGFKKIQTGLNNLTGNPDFGIGTFALPFTKTPANILDKAVDYSPVGSIKAISQLLSKKEFNQKLFIDRVSRSLTGTGMIMLGYDMAKNGLLTGSANKDKDVAAFERQTGKTPYSIKTGNIYNSIDFLQPAAIPLIIGADIYQNGKSKNDAKNIISDAIISGGTTLFDQSLLQGMQRLFGGNNPVQGIANSLTDIPTQFVPTALKQVTQLIDPTMRDTYNADKNISTLNQLKAKVPGLSQTLQPRIDTFGRTVQQFNGNNNPFNVLFNPGYTNTYNPNDTEKMIVDLYNQTGDKAHFPRVAKNAITYKAEKDKNVTINLTPQEKTKLQQFIGQQTQERYSSALQNSDFLNKSARDKVKYLQSILTKIYDEGEQNILKDRGIKEYGSK